MALTDHQQEVFDRITTDIRKGLTGNSDYTLIALNGYAGVGKTFLLSEIIKHFNSNYRQTVTAPTHKAVKVIVDTLEENNCPKIDSRTIHSFLKLKLEDDHDNGKRKLSKNLFGEDVDDKIDILYCDESSMVSNELLEYAVEKIERGSLKVIVMIGDIFQLKPVDGDENTSEFIKMEQEYRLTEIVRQSLDNPIIATSQVIKEFIENEVYPDIDAELFNKLTVVSGRKEFMTKYFADDSDKKIGTYTNDMVQRYNNYVRNLTKNKPKDCLMVGDFLEFQDSLFKGNKLIHLNSETVEVASCKKMYDNYYKMSYWNVIDTDHVAFPVLDFDDQPEFKRRLDKLAKIASSTKDKNERKQKWGQYFALKNKYANVRYHYCSTLHRLQGSTLDNVYLDLSDLSNPYYDKDTVYRLIYVGITRARNDVIILL